MLKKVGYLAPLLITLVVILFFVKGLKQNPNLLPSTLIKKEAPAFNLKVLNSQQSTTQAVFQGKYTLLVVWASWCDSCKDEQSYLLQIHQRYPKLHMIGLDYKDNPQDAITWLKKYGNPFHLILQDTTGSTAIDYGVYGTPESFLIDPQGTIIAKHVGILNNLAWQQDIQPALPNVM